MISLKDAALLVEAGVDLSRESREVARQITRYLDEQYNYSRPKTAPVFAIPVFFREVRCETIGTRQFVLERGTIEGRYWRIRERIRMFPMRFFVWTHYANEADAISHWEGFLAFVRGFTHYSIPSE